MEAFRILADGSPDMYSTEIGGYKVAPTKLWIRWVMQMMQRKQIPYDSVAIRC